jgi:hypothetical protein
MLIRSQRRPRSPFCADILIAMRGVSRIPPPPFTFENDHTPLVGGGGVSGIPLPPVAWNRPPSPRSEEGRDGISPPELWSGNAVQYCVLLKNGEGGIRYTPPPLCVSDRSDPPILCQGGYPGHPLLRSETLVAGLFLHNSITSETEGNGSPGIVIGGGGYLTPPPPHCTDGRGPWYVAGARIYELLDALGRRSSDWPGF